MARKQVEDAELAIQQEQEDMWAAEIVGETARKPESTFEERLNTIRARLSNLASSDK